MNNLGVTLRYGVKYKGRTGQWAWIFHRIAGLGVAFFLTLHIIDTSTVYFAPKAYEWFAALYKTPLFGLAEIGLLACVIYHALNGLRVIAVDFWPRLTVYQRQMSYGVGILFFVIFLPAGGIMLVRVIRYALGGA